MVGRTRRSSAIPRAPVSTISSGTAMDVPFRLVIFRFDAPLIIANAARSASKYKLAEGPVCDHLDRLEPITNVDTTTADILEISTNRSTLAASPGVRRIKVPSERGSRVRSNADDQSSTSTRPSGGLSAYERWPRSTPRRPSHHRSAGASQEGPQGTRRRSSLALPEDHDLDPFRSLRATTIACPTLSQSVSRPGDARAA